MIEVVSVAGLATIQDGGRTGHMHEGVPPGGALAPGLFARANAAARNPRGEAAIEVFGAIAIAARGHLVVATDDGGTAALDEGQTYSLSTHKTRVRYLAVRGGIDVPRVLGSRGTLLVARLGGHEGRALRRGDLLKVGDAGVEDAAMPPRVDGDAPVRVVPGPDLDRFAPSTIDAFFAFTFVVDARSDRVGTRLAGPRLVCPEEAQDSAAVSAPMVRGAIQVPPSGEPVVLGPDHPTTGGYPVIATVTRAHLGLLEARSIGAAVRFVV
jgi:biotin-dependent carboxylase-like uncharacterized protein